MAWEARVFFEIDENAVDTVLDDVASLLKPESVRSRPFHEKFHAQAERRTDLYLTGEANVDKGYKLRSSTDFERKTCVKRTTEGAEYLEKSFPPTNNQALRDGPSIKVEKERLKYGKVEVALVKLNQRAFFSLCLESDRISEAEASSWMERLIELSSHVVPRESLLVGSYAKFLVEIGQQPSVL